MAGEGQIAVIGCPDENVWFEGVKLGIVATGVVGEQGTGNQVVYPDATRKLLQENQQYIYPAMDTVANLMGTPLVGTSHPGCGGAEAQGIPGSDVDRVTAETCAQYGVAYIGMVPASGELQDMGDGVSAMFNRVGHRHETKDTVFSVGGGFTKAELDSVTEGRGAFGLSADWTAIAINAGMSPEAVAKILAYEHGLGQALTDGESATTVTVFDAGRLPQEVADQNRSILGTIFPNLV